MNFGDILADVYRRCGYATSPDSAVQTRIKAFVNETYQELLSVPGMEYLTHDRQKLASEVDRQRYGLAISTTARIRNIRDTTNRIMLGQLSLSDWRQLAPVPSRVTGTPTHFVDLGLGIARNIEDTTYGATSVAGGLGFRIAKIGFQNTGGVDTRNVYLRGIETRGTYVAETVALSGTSQVYAANLYRSIQELYTTAAANTDVEIQIGDSAGGLPTSDTSQVLNTLYSGTYSLTQHCIALYPTPSAAISYDIDFERVVNTLTQDSEIPVLLPDKFHRLLAMGARAKEYEKLNLIDKWTLTQAEYKKGFSAFKLWLYQAAAGEPNLRDWKMYGDRRRRHDLIVYGTS